MSVSALLSRVQVLEAQQQQTNAKLAAVSSEGSAGSMSLNWLDPALTVASWSSDAGAQGWANYLNSNIPTSATAVVLQVYGQHDDTFNGQSKIYARASSSGQVYLLFWSTWGSSTSDVDGAAGQFTIPCSNGGFQWSSDNGLRTGNIQVVGYWGPSS